MRLRLLGWCFRRRRWWLRSRRRRLLREVVAAKITWTISRRLVVFGPWVLSGIQGLFSFSYVESGGEVIGRHLPSRPPLPPSIGECVCAGEPTGGHLLRPDDGAVGTDRMIR